MIEIYTDGSCLGNGKENNKGGYGICALIPDQTFSSGYRLLYNCNKSSKNTTNNRQELEALLRAIELTQTIFKNKKCIIYCDSAYCVNICTNWMWTWVEKEWKNSKGQTIENLDLVSKIYNTIDQIPIPNFQIKKTYGHIGVLGNEIADALAKNDMDKLSKIFKENDIGTPFEKSFDIL